MHFMVALSMCRWLGGRGIGYWHNVGQCRTGNQSFPLVICRGNRSDVANNNDTDYRRHIVLFLRTDLT